MADLVQEVSKQTYDNLIGGTYPHIITAGATIAAKAGKLKRGTVLGKVTESGKYITADSSKTDGSQVGSAILIDDVDASGDADVVTEIYVSGMFNANALTFGGEDTRAKQEENLRLHDIYLTAEK
jgi:hypothetical protein|nr:MAG TPA: Head decoration protein [Caudovirales sp. ctNII2]